MADKAINLNHSTGTITTSDDTIVHINGEEESFGLLIGDGTSPILKNSEGKLEEGLLSVKDNKIYQTTKQGEWKLLGEPYDDATDIIYTLIMGR